MIKKKLVRETIHALISDEERRRNYLEIMLSVIKKADSYGKNKWGVHCRKNLIRVLVGNLIVFTIEKECLWCALEKELAEKDHISREPNTFWKWDTDEYPMYIKVPSINGYYVSSNLTDWNQIEPLHFAFIQSVSQKYQKLNIKSQRLHEPEVLNYLRKEFHESVPEPLYHEGVCVGLAEELDDACVYYEGVKKTITVNAYERNPEARLKCLEYYGTNCEICGFNFEDTYGEIGKGYIHVHHVIPLSEIAKEYKIDPIRDLRPVCPNCHAMLHKGIQRHTSK
jgi:hypothetical protein